MVHSYKRIVPSSHLNGLATPSLSPCYSCIPWTTKASTPVRYNHPLLFLLVRKPGKWRKFWTRDYTTTVDNTKSNGWASINQVGSRQSTLRMLPTKSILSTPAIPENLGLGISQELDPREGATATTLGARTPAPQPLSFSHLSHYTFPRFFPILVILSMVRVARQQWLSHIHVTHALVSNTWWLTCSWLITGYESIRFSLYLVSWHYLFKGINTRFFSLSYTFLSSLLYAPSCILLCT